MTDENLRHLSVLPFVKRWQKPLFFHDGYALRFIVGAFYQIRNSVYHYQMPPYLDNGKQALFPAHSRKVIRLKPFQYRLTSATTQQVDDILIQLHFALLHVIEQDCLVLAVFVERNAQRIHIRSGRTDSTDNQRRHIVTFSRAFSASDTKQIALSSERHAPAESYVHRMPDFLTDRQRIPPKLSEMPQSISIKEAMDTLDGKLVIGGVPKPGNKDDPNPDQPEKPKPKLKL